MGLKCLNDEFLGAKVMLFPEFTVFVICITIARTELEADVAFIKNSVK